MFRCIILPYSSLYLIYSCTKIRGKILDVEIIHAIFWMRENWQTTTAEINYNIFFLLIFHIKILLRKLEELYGERDGKSPATVPHMIRLSKHRIREGHFLNAVLCMCIMLNYVEIYTVQSLIMLHACNLVKTLQQIHKNIFARQAMFITRALLINCVTLFSMIF